MERARAAYDERHASPPGSACEECNDAVAVTERKFNGVTLLKLCEPCAAFWDRHGLSFPYRGTA
jgi:hypothetical protein